MTSMSTTSSSEAALAPSVAKLLAALDRLGEATAAAAAAEAGLGYSTTTPKLRILENAGLAEPIRSDDGRTLWRLTEAGRQQAAPAESGPPSALTAGTAADGPAQASPTGQHPRQHSQSTGPDDTRVPGATSAVESPAVVVDVDEPSGMADGEPAEQHADPAPGAPGEPGSDRPHATDVAAADHASAHPVGEAADPRPATESAARAGNRRVAGTLRGAILDILEAHPDQGYKVSELCKLIDRDGQTNGAKRASAGAVHNAAMKLVATASAVLTVEQPATFALARTDA
jgi:DNA-binding MarR family transcriptional regulator